MNQPETQRESIESQREQLFSELAQRAVEIKRIRSQLHPHDFTDAYRKMRGEIIRQYPEFRNIIETVFGINGFVRSHENFNYHREALVREQQTKELINLADWQHRATEILVGFGWNKAMSEKFWQQVEGFYKIFSNHPEDFEGYKRGVIGQARAFLILQELGYSPRLATPREDVLEGTDFYIFIPGRGEKIRAQVKASSQNGESIVDLVDCGSPSIVVDDQDGRQQTRFQEAAALEVAQIREKCGTLSQREGKMVRSLIIILNESDFNADGRPKLDFLNRISAKIAEKLKS